MPHVIYKLEQVFMYDTYLKNGSARKVGRRFHHKIQDVTVPHTETVCRIVNKLRQTW
jgi:hypothetical protein